MIKPFDLKAALAGAKVVTRDGREVSQITYFPLSSSEESVYALICGKVLQFYNSGVYLNHRESEHDLLMGIPSAKHFVLVYSYKNNPHRLIVHHGSDLTDLEKTKDNKYITVHHEAVFEVEEGSK